MPEYVEPEGLPDGGLLWAPHNRPVALDSGTSLVTDPSPRCWRCDKKFVEYVTRPWHVDCDRCKAVNRYPHPALDSGTSLVTDPSPRCWRCDNKFGEYFTRPWHADCDRCKAVNRYPHPSESPTSQTD